MKTTKNIYLIPVLIFLLVMLQRAWFDRDESTTQKKEPVTVSRIGGLGKIKTFEKQNDILVHTDMLTVRISLDGGAITGASLPSFAQGLNDPNPFTLLSNNPQHLYVAQTGMSGDADLKFEATAREFMMKPDEDTLVVSLTAKDDFGRVFTKRFKFHRHEYHFEVESSVENRASTSWSGMDYSRLILRHDSDSKLLAKNIPVDLDAPKPGWFTFSTYTGPAYFSDAKPYVKLPFTEVEKKPLKQTIDSAGWVSRLFLVFRSCLRASIRHTPWTLPIPC
mgnify:CR=1 FL=1